MPDRPGDPAPWTRRSAILAVLAGMASGGTLGRTGRRSTAGARDRSVRPSQQCFPSGDTDRKERSDRSADRRAREDAYWYARFNLESVQASGHGVAFPATVAERIRYESLHDRIVGVTGVDRSIVEDDPVVFAPYRSGMPRYASRPVFQPQPRESTLRWIESSGSTTVTPATFAWSNLVAVSLAVHDELHLRVLDSPARGRYRALRNGVLAQIGVRWALAPGDGAIRIDDPDDGDEIAVAARFDAETRTQSGGIADPSEFAAVIWFLARLVRFAEEGRYGYATLDPIVPVDRLREYADGVVRGLLSAYRPDDVYLDGTIRAVALLLCALSWYASVGCRSPLGGRVGSYVRRLGVLLEMVIDEDGAVAADTRHRAAMQGLAGQGFAFASRLDGIDHRDAGRLVLEYLREELWDSSAATFASVPDATQYRVTPRDAGDVLGGINAACCLGVDDLVATFADFFVSTFDRGRLQRAETLASLDRDDPSPLPLPVSGDGPHGEAPVYNGVVEYDPRTGRWRVLDDRFVAGPSLYLAAQSTWLGERFDIPFPGRGMPLPSRDGGDSGVR